VRARTLDFSNVKESSGINPKHLEEGEYLAKVIEVRDDPAKDGEAMWNFLIQPEDHKTATYPYYVKLVENQLWKLRNLFVAAGVDVPKKAVKIDPNRVVGKTICIVLEDDEYDGKTKSVISALMPKEEFEGYEGDTGPADDDEDDDEEEDEPAPVAKKRGRPKKVVEEVEDDDEDEEEDEEPAPVKRGRGRPKKVVEPEEDEDEDDEEEEPAPKKKRGRPAKAAAAPAKKKRRVVEDDDDLDIDL
jgi:hypothetical protein